MKSKMQILPTMTLGAAVLAALASAQSADLRTGSQDPGVRPERVRDAEGMRELEDARENLHRQVRTELNQQARQFGQNIRDGDLVLSVTDRGMVAGAPGTGTASMGTASSTPGMGTDGTERSTGHDPSRQGGGGDGGQGQEGFGRNDSSHPSGADGKGDIEGIVLVTGDLVPNAPGVQPGQSPGVAAFEVRCDPTAKQVQLVTSTGQVAASFPLIEIDTTGERFEGTARESSAAKLDDPDKHEASARREHAMGGDPYAKDWNRTYASIVCGLTKKQSRS